MEEPNKSKNTGKKLPVAKRVVGRKLKNGLKATKSVIAKINIGNWIDQLEQDQVLADDLEDLNTETLQQAKRKELVQQAKEACMTEIQTHLDRFLRDHPQATYNDWIRDLHPDNVDQDKIDNRFFVADSDHRILWNEHHKDDPGRQVASIAEDQR